MSTSKAVHKARQAGAQLGRAIAKPNGNYDHSEHQWGVVEAINPGPPATVDLYLDGTQNTKSTAGTAYLTKSVKYLSWYVPTLGDVVLVFRGKARSRTSRVVLGKLASSPSPYPLPFGNIDPGSGRFITGPNAMWGGVGVPAVALGTTGDYYCRTDTPAVTLQRLYVKTASGWTGIL